MAREESRKIVPISHIYAGTRVYRESGEADMLWDKTWNEQYFKLMKKYKDVVWMELAGHDHW